VEGQSGYLINPRLVEASGSLGGSEACLSIPGVSGCPERASYAVVTGVDLRNEPVTVAGTGELARCLQHETDHLLGTLYIDRLPSAERARLLRRLDPLTSPPEPGPGEARGM
jgi:peptide deformylase